MSVLFLFRLDKLRIIVVVNIIVGLATATWAIKCHKFLFFGILWQIILITKKFFSQKKKNSCHFHFVFFFSLRWIFIFVVKELGRDFLFYFFVLLFWKQKRSKKNSWDDEWKAWYSFVTCRLCMWPFVFSVCNLLLKSRVLDENMM